MSARPLDVFQSTAGAMCVRVNGGPAWSAPFTAQECAARLADCVARGASLKECVRALVPHYSPDIDVAPDGVDASRAPLDGLEADEVIVPTYVRVELLGHERFPLLTAVHL